MFEDCAEFDPINHLFTLGGEKLFVLSRKII